MWNILTFYTHLCCVHGNRFYNIVDHEPFRKIFANAPSVDFHFLLMQKISFLDLSEATKYGVINPKNVITWYGRWMRETEFLSFLNLRVSKKY